MAGQISFDVLAKDVNASRTFKKVGDAAEDAGDSLKGMAKDSVLLARQIEGVEDHLEDLRREFARTGDVSLKKIISANERDLAFLNKIKKNLGDIGDDAGKTVSKGFASGVRDSLGSLPSELKGAMIAGVVGAAVVTAPLVGGVIAGGVLGAVGGGGIIGGIALAAQDPRVAEAGQDVGARLMDELRKEFGEPFVEPVLIALQRVEFIGKRTIHGLSDEVGDLAKLVDPVVDGLDRAAVALGPGLADGLKAAEPVIRLIGNELPELAESISYAISAVSEESDGATMALAELFNIIEYGIEFGGDFVATLSSIFEWLVNTSDAAADLYLKLNPLGSILTPGISMLKDETGALKNSLADAKDESDDLRVTTVSTTDALRHQAQIVKSLNDAFEKLFGIQMSVDEANIRYQAAIDKTLETLRDGKRTLDINTEAGRDNKQAVLDQIAAIEDLRDANVANGMSLDDANGKYSSQLAQLEKTLIKLGFNKDQVRELIKAYKDVPAKVQTDVTASGLAGVLARMRELDRLYYNSPAFVDYRAGERNPAGARASGGPVMAGMTYKVGENGPELVTFGADGYVHNAKDSKAMLAGSSMPGQMGGTVAVSVSVVPSASARDKLAELVLEMLRVDAGFRSTVADYVGGP